jgi:hypothetical protein
MNNSPLCNEFSYYNKSPFVLDSYYVPCVWSNLIICKINCHVERENGFKIELLDTNRDGLLASCIIIPLNNFTVNWYLSYFWNQWFLGKTCMPCTRNFGLQSPFFGSNMSPTHILIPPFAFYAR